MSDAQGSATNPYVPHCCVTDSQDLYGRDSILAELERWLEAPQLTRGFFSISGGHKIGKSSVLRCFQKIGGTGGRTPIIVYCDLSRDDLISRLQEEIATQFSPSPPIPPMTRVRRQSAKEWIQAIGDRQLYVLLDSYDSFVDSARDKDEEETRKHDLFELLAEWLEERSCGGYAFATRLYKEEEQHEIIRKLRARAVVARVRVDDIMKTRHETKHKKDLELLKKEDALALIRQVKDRATPSPFCRSDEKFILKQAGCHPHWLQSLCCCLYEEYKQCGLVPRVPGLSGAVLRLMRPRAIRRCRRKALQRVRQEHLDIAFGRIWDWYLASGTLRDTLTEIARNPGIKYRKKSKAFVEDVKQLEREGLVEEREDGRVTITAKLFQAFACEQNKPPRQPPWLRYILLAIPVGLAVILLSVGLDVIIKLLEGLLFPSIRNGVVSAMGAVTSALPVWLWLIILIIIIFVTGIITLSKRDVRV